MLMTEQKATGLMCPMLTSSGDTAHCQGSFCMAWRTVRQIHCIDEPAPTGPARGYCGLAGKPEER